MRDVAGMPYPAVRSNWTGGVCDDAPSGGAVRSGRSGAPGSATAVVGPVFAATVLTALILHLLVGLAARLPASDLLGALSVVVGMAVVLVTLMPFTLLCVRRARRAWAVLQDSPGETGAVERGVAGR